MISRSISPSSTSDKFARLGTALIYLTYFSLHLFFVQAVIFWSALHAAFSLCFYISTNKYVERLVVSEYYVSISSNNNAVLSYRCNLFYHTFLFQKQICVSSIERYSCN